MTSGSSKVSTKLVAGVLMFMGLAVGARAFYKSSNVPNGRRLVTTIVEGLRVDLPQLYENHTGVARLLPEKAMIVEQVDLSGAVDRPRALVLWMSNPQRVLRDPTKEYGCSEATTGDHFSGPTRVSLIDTKQNVVLNTIGVHRGTSSADMFDIPFRIKPALYEVPTLDASGQGRPMILNARDYNGDGIAAEFIFYDAKPTPCGEAETTLIGYSAQSDAVVHYPVESTIETGATLQLWAMRADVSFDSVRQLFVQKSLSPKE
jgi:hypothetical protein